MQSQPDGPQDPPRDAATVPADVRWRFGSFVVWEAQRRLEWSGQAVRLGPRSFDLLLQLLAQAGELVSKEALLSAVWAGVVVEEASVRVHMSLLRKALGEPGYSDACKEWITNVPLRGYRFNGKVVRELIESPDTTTASSTAAFTKLPVRLTELVGRKADVEAVITALDAHRLVTIVGPGGIGKTSVAIRAAERWQQSDCSADAKRQPCRQVAFVDLSPLISPDHVLGTMARSLGVAADLPDPLHAITRYLAGRDVLLLIDNCEHVVESLALPITQLLTALPTLRILATSREALRVSGEYVLRLSALAVPDAEGITLAQALQWPSVELLIERARAAGAGTFDESDGPMLARISRQLDGIPLAIELVAARLGVQSVGELASRLDHHMRLLSIDNRAALPRHRTLAAALDWSIALLDEDEIRVFRRLSVFRGRFDVESALCVIASDMDQELAFDALISLADKSLVFFDRNDAIAPYRLLDTTRSYAAALLARSDERPLLLRCHAMFVLDLMKTATAELPDLTEQAWDERYARHLDDVRFALEVCLAGQVDAKIAAALVIASAPLWFHVSQVAEYRSNVEAAIGLIDQDSGSDEDTATWLTIELMIALLHTNGSNADLDSACDRALAGALASKVRVMELQARWGRCTHDMFSGDYAAALQHSETLLAVAESWSDPGALNLAHRVGAMANHFSGRFEVSRQHCEASLLLSDGARRTRTNMVGVDPVIAAKAMLCRTLWIQGETAQAMETATDAVARAKAAGHAASMCAALYGACPVAVWSGELELAGQWIQMMMDEARRKGLVRWLRYAQWFFQGLQVSTANDPVPHIREVSDRFASYDPPHKEMLVTFCTEWVDDGMIARLASGEGLWSAAEVWRAVGWRSERRGMADEAADFYLRALDVARQQGAKGWELRAALSLAGLWVRLDRPQQAAQLLDETCGGAAAGSDNTVIMQVRELREGITRLLA